MNKVLFGLLISVSLCSHAQASHKGIKILSGTWSGKDITDLVKKYCNNKSECDYKLAVKYVGHPVDRSNMNFNTVWFCGNDRKKYSLSLSHNSEDKIAKISCKNKLNLNNTSSDEDINSPDNYSASYQKIILNDKKNSGMRYALGDSCVEYLQDIYKSGKKLKSKILARNIKKINEEFNTNLDFFHYTNAEVFFRIFQDNKFEEIFHYYREINVKESNPERALWKTVHFIAEDPYSSKGYGRIKTIMYLKPDCRFLDWDNSWTIPVLNELSSNFSNLKNECNISHINYAAMEHNNLHFIIAEDSGVDVIRLAKDPNWSVMLNPSCINKTKIEYK